jgi:hypothetical protein
MNIDCFGAPSKMRGFFATLRMTILLGAALRLVPLEDI